MALTNTQYNMIMRDYFRQQSDNHALLSKRINEVYSRNPEFAQIDAAIAHAGTLCARRMLSDEPASAEELRREIAGYSERRAVLLREAGYPEDYLSPVYRCPDCQDTGYIGSVKCHCFRQAEIDLLYQQSNLRELLQNESFDQFSLEYYSPAIIDPVTGNTAAEAAARALSECRNFTTSFDTSFENLFLYGDTGLGKTFLSHCIARELLDTAHSVIYFSAFHLFELIADSAFRTSSRDEHQELEQHIYDCDLLIIDDLGTELTNSFVASQLFSIINERILRKKSTLISTNLSLSSFADIYTERVFSRITSNYTMLKLAGDDIRLQKKLKRIQQ